MFHRKNLIFIGLLLLLVFVGAVWLVGIQIDKAAVRMHSAMVQEVGAYRSELIRQDFKRTEELQESVQAFLEKKGYDKEGLTELLEGVLKMDNKVTRAWFVAGGDHVVCTRGKAGADGAVWTDTVLSKDGSGLYKDHRGEYWSLRGHYGGVNYGFDIDLSDLHAYFAVIVPAKRNYIYILNEAGVYITYPDEKQVGKPLPDLRELERVKAVIRDNKELQMAGFSNYLLLPVDKVYYPIAVGTEKWVVVVNVLQLDNQEAMEHFHRYALLIAVVTVLIFSVLLAISQYKWRKEYDLRRKVEQEALQLNLQQLKNQLNPHFLFNALNSLSALITADPALAEEFVLKLSKVYRYVLEKRNETLASVKEEVDFTCHYYFLQKIRFGEQLLLKIENDVKKADGMIPAMSLQLLLENAIKHNEITRLHPLHIRIYLSEGDLVVENSYCPRSGESSDSMGIGLENIQKIYAYYSQERFHYTVENSLFICKLPILKG